MSEISMVKPMRFYYHMNINPENVISKYWYEESIIFLLAEERLILHLHFIGFVNWKIVKTGSQEVTDISTYILFEEVQCSYFFLENNIIKLTRKAINKSKQNIIVFHLLITIFWKNCKENNLFEA